MVDDYESTGGSPRSDKAVSWADKHASQRQNPVTVLILHTNPESPLPSAALATPAPTSLPGRMTP